MFGSSKKQTIGYWFRPLFHYGLCKGVIDAFLELRGGGRTAWKGLLTSSGRISVNKPSLWGGESSEGGLDGEMDIMFGDANQATNDYLTEHLGGDQPTYRGKTTAVWRGGRYGAINPYHKPLAFKLRRTLKGWDNDVCWYPDKAEIVVRPDVFLMTDLAVSASVATYGEFPGFTLSGGFTAKDTLTVDKVLGMTHKAWSEWADIGLPFTNRFSVTTEEGETTQYWPEYYDTADDAEQATLGRSINLTGSTSYTFWINDSPLLDNRGGLSLRVYIAGFKTMNAAHILYDSITADDMGGEPVALINDASFRISADILFDEGFGLCTVFDDDSVQDFQQRILDVIGGSINQSQSDGLYYLDLIRAVDDIGVLPIIISDDVVEFSQEPSSYPEAVNQIQVEWFDVESKKNRTTAPLQALGAINSAGEVIAGDRKYPEIPTEELAISAGLRDLYAGATPLSKFNLVINRRFPMLRPATYFRLQLPEEGIADMVCLVGDIDRGTLNSGKTKIVAVQDVFSFPQNSYIEPESGLSTIFDDDPISPVAQKLIEAPYIALAATLSNAELPAFPDDAGLLLSMAARPSSGLNYRLYTETITADYEGYEIEEYCPTGLVVESVDFMDTIFTLSAYSDLENVDVGSWGVWDDEIVRVDAINPELATVSLARGCADSIPAKHDPGSRIWFCSEWAGTDGIEYVTGDTASAILASRTYSNEQPLSDTSIITLLFSHRQFRPLPPRNVKANGGYFPQFITGNLLLTWSLGDRFLQSDQLLDFTTTTIGPEAGTTVNLKLYNQDDVLVKDLTGITAETFEWDTEVDDSGIVAPAGDPFWGNVVLSLHFNGIDESTTFIDSSDYGRTITVIGGSMLDTEYKKFGTASGLFNGVDSALTIPHDTLFNLSSGDVTIDGWLYVTALPTSGKAFAILSKRPMALTTDWEVLITDDGKLKLWAWGSGVSVVEAESASFVPTNTWVHFAVERLSGTWKVYINGVGGLGYAQSGSIVNSGGPVYVGRDPITSIRYFNGWLDELRFTKGAARYGEDFTPPVVKNPDYPYSETVTYKANDKIRIQLSTSRDGFDSLQSYDFIVNRQED